jgi:hypothetical protein
MRINRLAPGTIRHQQGALARCFDWTAGEASGNHGAESTTAPEARDVGVQHAVLLEVRKMSCPGSIAIDMPPTACAIGQPDDVDINEILFRATQQKY